MCEVDVFEQPRFCDDFSHLVNMHFAATASLCLKPTSMEKMFETM